MRFSSCFEIRDLYGDWPQTYSEEDGRWVMSRPLSHGSLLQHLKVVFLVATGKADAIVWSGKQ